MRSLNVLLWPLVLVVTACGSVEAPAGRGDAGAADAAVLDDAGESDVDAGAPVDAGCRPESDSQFCSRLGKECGAFTGTDNCGLERSVDTCGTCSGTATCGADPAQPNVCACIPESDQAFCARLSRNCGKVTGTDTCGRSRTVASCGICSTPETCGGGDPRVANVCGCTSESSAEFCARLGNNCGQVTGADNCGISRSESCGVCSAPETCGGGNPGVPNVCGCTPETDAQFCARLGQDCDALSGVDLCGAQRSVASCGSCQAPQTCGGGGAAGHCGAPAFTVTAPQDISTPVPVPSAQVERRNPAVGDSATHYLVAWEDYRSLSNTVGYAPSLYATRIRKSDGRIEDPAGIRLAWSSYGDSGFTKFAQIKVASNGTDFLVAYEYNYGACRGQRVRGSDGVVLDPTPISLGADCESIAWDGSLYWIVVRTGLYSLELHKLDPATGAKVGAPIQIATAAGNRFSARLVMGSGGALVAWSDERYKNANQADIYAARLRADGTVMDPGGFVVCDDPYNQEMLEAAFDGTQYLLAWKDGRNTSSVYRATVDPGSPAGVPVNGAELGNISTALRRLVFENGNYVAYWRATVSTNAYKIVSARIRPSDFAVLDVPAQLVEDGLVHYDVAVGSDAATRLVVSPNSPYTFAMQLAASLRGAGGAAIGSPKQIISTLASWQGYPASAFSGSSSLVGWQEARVPGPTALYGTIVSSTGTIASPSGFQISSSAQTLAPQTPPAIGFAGNVFIAAWSGSITNGQALYASRVSTAGVVLDTTPVVVNGYSSVSGFDSLAPRIACGTSSCLLVWQEVLNTTYKHDVRAAILTPSSNALSVTGPFTISGVGGEQRWPAVASDGTDFLVIWSDDKLNSSDIFGLRVSSTGQLLDTQPVRIYDGSGFQNGAGKPAVEFDGTNYLAAWSASALKYGRVRPADAALLDGNGVTVMGTTSYLEDFALTRNGSQVALFFKDSYRSKALRFAGGVIVDPRPIDLPDGLASVCAASAQDYLLLTSKLYPDGPYENNRVHFQLLHW